MFLCKKACLSDRPLCFRQHNQIRSVEGSQLMAYRALEVLDLSWNDLTEVHSACFLQGPPLKEL